jgi:PAS domain S-box-containing protein
MLSAVGDLPLVVLTGSSDGDVLPLAAVKLGAHDFLAKDALDGDRLARSLVYAIERRRWNERLKRSEARLEEAQAMAHVGNWDHDLERGELHWSKELYRIVGLDEHKPVSYQSVLAYIHPEDRARVEATIDQARRAGDSYMSEFRIVRTNGETRTLLVRGRFDAGSEGRARRSAGTVQDITERKEMEANLLIAGRMAAVGTLASGVAHEINNPLAAILGNLDYLTSRLEALAQERGELAGVIPQLAEVVADSKDGAQRIRDVVKHLMVFSDPVDSGRTQFQLRPLLDAAIGMAQNALRHRAQVVREYADVPPVMGNEGRLAHVIVQLLVNAAQAIPDDLNGRGEVRVRTLRAADGDAVIEVHDNGVGIPRDILGRIFDPFFTTKPLGSATGLGLSTAHAIVTSLGGTLTVDSTPGHGSTFRLTLPTVQPHRPPTAKGTHAEPRPLVLIVDDDPAVGHMLQRLLAREYEVIVTLDATAASKQLAQYGSVIDVILCDVMMPKVTGMDFLESVRKSEPNMAKRIIFMTGGAFTPRAREFLENLPDQYLTKPFDPETLFSAVRQCIARRARESDAAI